MAARLSHFVQRVEAGVFSCLPARAAISGWRPVVAEAVAGHAGIAVLRTPCILGESPLWDPVSESLTWLDIRRWRLHSWQPACGVMRSHRLPGLPGAAAHCRDGRLLLATPAGVGYYDLDSCRFERVAGTAADWPRSRFNDGKCDRAGRFWSGTMRTGGASGREKLCRFEAGRGLAPVDWGFTTCNGLGWSPDDRTFYLADTAAARIYAYDFDLASGAVANRRVFAQLAAGAGRPDGLAVDADGGVWVANSGGWGLTRYDPEGGILRSVRLPVPRPTSCVFGGAGLATLYVTSSRLGLSRRQRADAPLSGGLFVLEVGVRGLPDHRFAN
jgi:sugar lactone lactonase YvrE